MFPRSIGRATRTATRSISTTSSDPVLAQLLSLSLPLIKSTGFSTETLIRASVLLPPPHTPLAPAGYSTATLDALFPSPPPTPKVNSMTREEIIADARGEMEGEALGRERFGPAQALVEEWLREGRRFMCDQVRDDGSKGEEAIRKGMEMRIRYNQDYIDLLPDVSLPFSTGTKGKLFISISSPGSRIVDCIGQLAPRLHLCSLTVPLARSLPQTRRRNRSRPHSSLRRSRTRRQSLPSQAFATCH